MGINIEAFLLGLVKVNGKLYVFETRLLESVSHSMRQSQKCPSLEPTIEFDPNVKPKASKSNYGWKKEQKKGKYALSVTHLFLKSVCNNMGTKGTLKWPLGLVAKLVTYYDGSK